jgi:acetyl esterase/lipase
VIGFSAGGHLAAAAATMAEHRPAAAILGYPVIQEDTVHECEESAPGICEHVDENTCPCFLFATRTDSVVPIQNTLDMMNALN